MSRSKIPFIFLPFPVATVGIAGSALFAMSGGAPAEQVEEQVICSLLVADGNQKQGLSTDMEFWPYKRVPQKVGAREAMEKRGDRVYL